ncbi:MAG: 23S rRNA (guanosine(2251)-2'-O)-methyltransferase RlmB [Sandaracinaceae bacterium]|nr:23S rRNA (guanosine(2251)-2'-O)-methyltransferase RlmB [Sandaracinaceae bacterium]MDW8245381.1 23S rRNA (guanosine(2251)-2'-O)-methyltransferase RlmB [Sandaracinaceae bacterium]
MSRLLLGPHALNEAIKKGKPITVVYASEPPSQGARLLIEKLQAKEIPVLFRSRAELDVLAKGAHHQGVIGVAKDYEYASPSVLENIPQSALIVALDQITDPHNFGAILRSAVAFKSHAVITLVHRACPVTPTVVRASAGATEHASIVRVVNLARTLRRLKEKGAEVLGLDAEASTDIDALPPSNQPRVLVVGSEGKGLRQLVRKQCDHLVRIPMAGSIDSLNASVAVGIALFVLSRERLRSEPHPSDAPKT